MRKHVMFILCLAMGLCSFSQATSDKVRITNWGEKVFAFPKNYWNNKWTDEIIGKIGIEEFNRMKASLLKNDLPVEMSILNVAGTNAKDTTLLFDKLNKLNMYRIATYTQAGSDHKVFEMAILAVPYERNKEWDKNVKWEMLYFVIENKFVEPSN